MLRVIEELAGDWRRLDQRIDGLSGEIDPESDLFISEVTFGGIASSCRLTTASTSTGPLSSFVTRFDIGIILV